MLELYSYLPENILSVLKNRYDSIHTEIIDNLELGPAQAYVEFKDNLKTTKYPYVTLAKAIKLSKNEIDDNNISAINTINLLFNTLEDDLQSHITKNTKLIKRINKLEVEVVEDFVEQSVTISFYFRVVQVSKGVLELSEWKIKKEEGEYIQIIK